MLRKNLKKCPKLLDHYNDKQGELTFADIIAIVRREIWSQRYFSKSANNDEFEKLGEQDIGHLIYQLSMAA